MTNQTLKDKDSILLEFLMKSFKLFVIACKTAILPSYFVFFLLRSAAMQCKKAFI